MWKSCARLYHNSYLNKRFFKTNRITSDVVNHAAVRPPIGKCFVFTMGATIFCYTGSSIWKYENDSSYQRTFRQNIRSLWSTDKITTNRKIGSFRQQANDWWSSQSEGSKIFCGICGVNVLVFVLTKVPRLQTVMSRYFLQSPSSSSSVSSLFLSAFHHHSLLHLGCNMYVLHSDAGVSLLGKENFLGTYLSACAISSYASYCFKVFSKSTVPSLGASGAIMTILGIVCTSYPDSKVCIVFLPMLVFSAGNIIKGIMALDALGLIMKWRYIDHAAHLGGALYGVGYTFGAHKLVTLFCDNVYDQWRSVRKMFRK